MSNKRGWQFGLIVIILAITLLSLFSNLVSAFSNPQYFVEGVIEGVKQIATPIFLALFGMYYSDEFLFTKILLFILLFVVIRTGVKAAPMFEGKNAIASLISLVISLFAVRYISEGDLIRGILLPYGTFAVAITVLIPFVIFFFVVEKTGKSGGWRKAAWFFYFTIMLILWINRRDQISREANFIYAGIIAVCILLFFFDKHIQEYFGTRADYKHTKQMIQDRINEEKRLYSLALSSGDNESMKEHLKLIKKLEEQKHSLS